MARLPRNVRRHHGGFRAVLSVDGKRKSSPTFPTPEKAEDWLRSHRAFLASGQVHTLADAYRALLGELEHLQRRPWTARYYRSNWRALTGEQGWGEDCPLGHVSQDQIRRYIRKRRAAGISESTIWEKEITTLNRLFRLAIAQGLAIANPVEGLTRPKVEHERFDFLPRDRVLNLIAAMRRWQGGGLRTRDRDADLVEFLFRTGCRRMETSHIHVEDVELDQRRVFIRRGKCGPRYAPIGTALVPVLTRQLLRARGGLLWGSYRIIQRCFASWQKRLEEPKFSAHVMRHSFATALAQAGVSPYDLMGLMGHKSLSMVTRYYHATEAGNVAAVDRLDGGGHVRESESC